MEAPSLVAVAGTQLILLCNLLEEFLVASKQLASKGIAAKLAAILIFVPSALERYLRIALLLLNLLPNFYSQMVHL